MGVDVKTSPLTQPTRPLPGATCRRPGVLGVDGSSPGRSGISD